ncbi:hypothetical protein SAMN04488543_1303 [Friedmanniella luteola]|uniref:HicB family toxin-antitoxin system n=1 Tax=Friedmanniella luteola TaxID=546871 RepID=A0A1H1QEY2_9ACTN|nr:hypothetical protein [Friedmanniella luteola]SDS21985.1 hypothetical protein SAMN04488543_1303 [Friedmanniella luteola]
MKYQVNVTRDGRWWMLEVPDLDVTSQARRLGEVEQMAREAIAVTTDAPVDGVQVELRLPDLGLVKASRLADLYRERAEIAEREVRLAAETRDVAVGLVDAGVPLRDVGEILGVSHQRVHQLVNQ